MAAPWIPLRINLVDDPRVCRIARAMVWPAKLPELVARRATVGALHAVWSWLDMHTEDGYVAGLTAEDIDGVAGISGFAAAMQTVGWLVIDEQGVTAPGFEQYCGTTAKRRMADARRKRRAGRRGPQELAELPSPANWSECGEGVLSGVVKIKAAGFQCASDRDGELRGHRAESFQRQGPQPGSVFARHRGPQAERARQRAV